MIQVKCILYIFLFSVLFSACEKKHKKNSQVTVLEHIISSNSVNDFSSPLLLETVQDKLGQGNQGHGSYIWYACENNKDEMWFWLDPKSLSSGDSPIVSYVSITPGTDPDTQKFIWPIEARGFDVAETLRKLYNENK